MQPMLELSRLLGPLRRTVLRRTREAAALPDLPEAQVELLRALEGEPPVSVGDAARQLGIAPSTVSNLVRTMTASGLVHRRRRDADQRAVELTLTPAATILLARYDDASSTLLEHSLQHLAPKDRQAVINAIPALRRLLAAISQSAPDR